MALVAITGVAIVAISQTREARTQRELTESRELAARALNLADTDPALSLALAREAFAKEPTDEAAAALRQTVSGFRALNVFKVGPTTVYGTDRSPDGKLVAAASGDGVLSLWNVGTAAAIAAGGTRTPLAAVGSRPDGGSVAIATEQGEVALVDLATGRRRVVMEVPNWRPCRSHSRRTASDSPRASRMAASASSTSRPIVTRTFSSPPANVLAVRLSDDGSRVAAGSSDDGAVRIWEFRRPVPRLTLKAGSFRLETVDLSGDGERVVDGRRERARDHLERCLPACVNGRSARRRRPSRS